jgi:hypothetical protein
VEHKTPVLQPSVKVAAGVDALKRVTPPLELDALDRPKKLSQCGLLPSPSHSKAPIKLKSVSKTAELQISSSASPEAKLKKAATTHSNDPARQTLNEFDLGDKDHEVSFGDINQVVGLLRTLRSKINHSL